MYQAINVNYFTLYYLFSPLGKLAERAIYFTFRNFVLFILLGAKLSQYLLDRFSRSFHHMEGICVNILDQVQFFRFLKGHCHGNQFCGKITYPLHLSLCLSKTEWDIALQICALIAPLIALHRMKGW